MITSYDQFVETSRAACRESLEMSTRWLLGAAAVSTATMKLIDASLERHAVALEKVSAARDVEDLFDLNATLIRDIGEEWLQRSTETGRQLMTAQMEALQSMHVDAYRFGDLYARLMRFGMVPTQPLIAPWSLFTDAVARMGSFVKGGQSEAAGDSDAKALRAGASKVAERKAS